MMSVKSAELYACVFGPEEVSRRAVLCAEKGVARVGISRKNVPWAIKPPAPRPRGGSAMHMTWFAWNRMLACLLQLSIKRQPKLFINAA